jgi:Cys-Gly metallodipeptidase DUG1
MLCLRAIYESIDFSVADVEHSAGASIALSENKVTVLMGRMRQSSLSLHGIEGAFSGPGAKTVIPAKVSGKFSIRCVLYRSGAVIAQIIPYELP